MKMMKELLLNEHGVIQWLLFYAAAILLLIPMTLLIFDKYTVDAIDHKINRTLNNLNTDIYEKLSIEYTAFEIGFDIESDEEAYAAFYAGLQSRLDLTDTLSPLPDSLADGPVTIDIFKVVHEDDLPYDDGNGRLMEYPGIIAKITVPIKTPLTGISFDMPVLITTEIYR